MAYIAMADIVMACAFMAYVVMTVGTEPAVDGGQQRGMAVVEVHDVAADHNIVLLVLVHRLNEMP